MDWRTLSEKVPTLIVRGELQRAGAMLQEAYAHAKGEGDVDALEHVLALLVQVYSSSEPPELVKAERFSLEREQIKPTAYNKHQTAMVLYHVCRDPLRAITRLHDVIEAAQDEHDSVTAYSALSLLGQALLDVNAIDEARAVLKEIDRMILKKEPVVIGDELILLERALAGNVETEVVRRIARLLAPVCRDPEFRQRLTALAVS